MKTRAPALLLLSLLLAATAACGGYRAPAHRPVLTGPPVRATASPAPTPEPTPPPERSPAEYRALVRAFRVQAAEQADLLLRAGLYEYNWWGSHLEDPQGVDPDEAAAQALQWLEEGFGADRDALSAAHGALLAAYAELKLTPVTGGAPPELSDPVDALVSAYEQLYTMVTRPAGALQEFVPLLCSCEYSLTQADAWLAWVLEGL